MCIGVYVCTYAYNGYNSSVLHNYVPYHYVCTLQQLCRKQLTYCMQGLNYHWGR